MNGESATSGADLDALPGKRDDPIQQQQGLGFRFADPALPLLERVMDPDWVLRLCLRRGIWSGSRPRTLEPEYFRHEPGRRAVVGYTADWGDEYWMGDAEFCVVTEAGAPEPRIYLYPEDPRLPGLREAASPVDAQRLLARYVGLHPQRLRVRTVRYRATVRAVLRYRLSWPRGQVRNMDIYARAMRPELVERWKRAHAFMSHSEFILPRALGIWEEGGIIWIDQIPGENLRKLIDEERAPDPEVVLAAMAPLWQRADLSFEGLTTRSVGTESVLDLLTKVVPEADLRRFGRSFDILREFATSWRPTGPAHNDFYDDQIIMVGERPAIVDFEEAGLGDAMLDVGYFLAHLRWRARNRTPAEPYLDYHRRMRDAAVASFGWQPSDLAVREANALFRLSGNPIRGLHPDGPARVVRWLEAMQEALE